MNSLYEALILVVIVSLIGFWEWRSALLMALSMPITLLMTFGIRRFDRRHIFNFAAGPGALRDLRARLEAGEVGKHLRSN